jgi:hypothetical protein
LHYSSSFVLYVFGFELLQYWHLLSY